LLVVAGEHCAKLMDEKMRGLKCHRIQGDELWCFVGKKQRNMKLGDCVGLCCAGRGFQTDSRLHGWQA
jgi:hypothetical protein